MTISLTSLLLPKWSGDLKYCPCPPCDQTRRYHDRRNRRRRRHFKRLLTAEFVSYDREIKGEGALAYRESNCISTSIIQLGCQHPCQRNQTRRYRASCVTHLWKLLKSKQLESRLRLESFPRSVSSSIFCMDLLSAFNNARFKFQGSGSNTLEVMSICLNHIKLKKFQENF